MDTCMLDCICCGAVCLGFLFHDHDYIDENPRAVLFPEWIDF